jgi:outer membrane protein OmpA-like peptidoglycan-associated protein
MTRMLVLALVCVSRVAAADRWLTAELPAATAVSAVQEQAFRPGAMPALGAYVTSGHFALGARLRAGILRNGAAPGGNMMDPGVGGLATFGAAGRVTFGDAWLEVVAGGGVTGSDVVPVFEAGIGYTRDVGSIAIGPSARYVRVVATAGDAFGSADLVLVGADVLFGRAHPRRVVPVHAVAVAAPVPPPAPEPEPTVARDDDRIVDQSASCADLLEFLDRASGCGPGAAVDVVGDRIILDDRVLFDTDHAHVHAAGRAVLRAIAKAAEAHPEWTTITVEGHTDVRGADDYNQLLSEHRAEAARAVLLKAGVDPDRVKTVGYGRTRPRDPGVTPEAHQRNRRVEFVIDRAVAP